MRGSRYCRVVRAVVLSAERRPRVRADRAGRPPPPTAGASRLRRSRLRAGRAGAALPAQPPRAVPAGREGRLRQPAARLPAVGRRQGRDDARAGADRRRSRPRRQTKAKQLQANQRSCRPSGSVMNEAARAQLEKEIERQTARGRALPAGRAGRDQRAAAGSCRTSSRRSCMPIIEQVATGEGPAHPVQRRRCRHRLGRSGPRPDAPK